MIGKLVSGRILLFGSMFVRINMMGINNSLIVMVVGWFNVIVVFRLIKILCFLKCFWKNLCVLLEMGINFLMIRWIMCGNSIIIVVMVIIKVVYFLKFLFVVSLKISLRIMLMIIGLLIILYCFWIFWVLILCFFINGIFLYIVFSNMNNGMELELYFCGIEIFFRFIMFCICFVV